MVACGLYSEISLYLVLCKIVPSNTVLKRGEEPPWWLIGATFACRRIDIFTALLSSHL